MRDKNVPYYLLIHTNNYTGNFERELIAYCLGILPESHESYAKEYKKAFWNGVVAADVDSLEEYIDFLAEYYKSFNKLENLNIKNIKENKEFNSKVLEKDKLLKLYSNYICTTFQQVDDWKEKTFYNIESFYKNKEYNCDTIYIQLKEPLNDYLENIVIERIKEFFENDIFNIIEDYRWVCEFGEKKNKHVDLKLLDLEVVNKKDELIKKYV